MLDEQTQTSDKALGQHLDGAPIVPPFTVGSLTISMQWRPATRPTPVISVAP